MKIYPGSTPEFRIFVHANGTQELQLRYVNSAANYTGLWQSIPVVKEVVKSVEG